jgi:bacterioferritin-associated ferredoxin
MYICICKAVTEREIRGAVELGCQSVSDLRRDLGVASGCGKCVTEAREVLRACKASCTGPTAQCGSAD